MYTAGNTVCFEKKIKNIMLLLKVSSSVELLEKDSIIPSVWPESILEAFNYFSIMLQILQQT